jgi:hypothetical protein
MQQLQIQLEHFILLVVVVDHIKTKMADRKHLELVVVQEVELKTIRLQVR